MNIFKKITTVKKVLKQPAEVQNQYFWYTSITKPNNAFKRFFKSYNSKPIVNFTFKEVDYIKRLFFEGDLVSIFEVLRMQYNCKDYTLLRLDIKVFLSLIRNLQKEVESILKEDEKLDTFSDDKVKMALKMSKADMMDQFGIYNAIDSLAQNDKSKWDMFENMPYYRVKFMLTFNTVGNSVNKKFQKNYNDLIKLEK